MNDNSRNPQLEVLKKRLKGKSNLTPSTSTTDEKEILKQKMNQLLETQKKEQGLEMDTTKVQQIVNSSNNSATSLPFIYSHKLPLLSSDSPKSLICKSRLSPTTGILNTYFGCGISMALGRSNVPTRFFIEPKYFHEFNRIDDLTLIMSFDNPSYNSSYTIDEVRRLNESLTTALQYMERMTPRASQKRTKEYDANIYQSSIIIQPAIYRIIEDISSRDQIKDIWNSKKESERDSVKLYMNQLLCNNKQKLPVKSLVWNLFFIFSTVSVEFTKVLWCNSETASSIMSCWEQILKEELGSTDNIPKPTSTSSINEPITIIDGTNFISNNNNNNETKNNKRKEVSSSAIDNDNNNELSKKKKL
jgi:hypothetical protein